MDKLPGTLWINRGRWNWKVRLPGSNKRKNYPVKQSNMNAALPDTKDRKMAESICWRIWERAGKDAIKGKAITTLNEVADQYLHWCEEYYQKADGSQTGQSANTSIALRPLRAKFGEVSANDVSYGDIISIREAWVNERKARKTVNEYTGIIKRFFCVGVGKPTL